MNERDDVAGDDAALFDDVVSASSQEPVTETPEPVAPAKENASEAPARDDSGRFAKAETHEQATSEQPETIERREPSIPSHRLKEEADARRAEKERADRLEALLMQTLQQRNAPPQQPEQPAETPEIWTDPDAWYRAKAQAEFSPVLQQMQSAMLVIARDSAVAVHGAETVDAAEKAFNELASRNAVDPADFNRIVNSPNRYRAAVEWHQRQNVLKEVGSDPKAYRERVLSEAMNDPEFVAKVIAAQRAAPGQGTTAAPSNITRLPPSLNKATTAARTHAAAQGDVSDQELFAQTVRGR